MGLIGARPAGACTCERAASENKKVLGNACACGQRAAGMLSFFRASIHFCYAVVGA